MKLLIALFLLLPALAFAQEIPRDGAKVSWQAPTARTDNTPLPPEELKGYELYWGTSSTASELTEMVFIDPELTEYMVTNLIDGTWYFAMKAVDTEDRTSAFSEIASKTIEPLDEPPPADPPQDPVRIDIR